MKEYIFNLETLKIELHFEKSEYMALSQDQKQIIKNNFLWSKFGGCWVSRCIEPHLHRAIDIAKSLGFEKEKRVGERLSYGERVDKTVERAELREERYTGYSDNAERRGNSLQKELNSYSGDIAFFTQPNINSSGGRAFTRAREKIYARYDKSFEEYRKSEYFAGKAATARETADMKKLKNKGYLDRQIKDCKKEIRNREKNIISYEERLYRIENGEVIKSYYTQEPLTAEYFSGLIQRELELVEKAMDKQGFMENCLDELGGVEFSKENIKPGYIVMIDKRWIGEVVGTGPVNITYRTQFGTILTAAYAEISKIIQAETKPKERHPFKIGDEFTVTRYDLKCEKHIFKIIDVTDDRIKLQNITLPGARTIMRKPVRTCNDNEWRWGFDDAYQNNFYRQSGANS